VNFIFENFITFTSRLPYSRHLEEEADEVGLQLAAKVNTKVLKDLLQFDVF
jgi:Zn-dependent protease with chaperone function